MFFSGDSGDVFPILPNEETKGRLGKVEDAREWDALKIDLK
jgi:hypothetical protein